MKLNKNINAADVENKSKRGEADLSPICSGV